VYKVGGNRFCIRLRCRVGFKTNLLMCWDEANNNIKGHQKLIILVITIDSIQDIILN
jgi:hypothetical protein